MNQKWNLQWDLSEEPKLTTETIKKEFFNIKKEIIKVLNAFITKYQEEAEETHPLTFSINIVDEVRENCFYDGLFKLLVDDRSIDKMFDVCFDFIWKDSNMNHFIDPENNPYHDGRVIANVMKVPKELLCGEYIVSFFMYLN